MTAETETIQSRAGSSAENWAVIKPLLCERIRRRWTALKRLSPPPNVDGLQIEDELAAAGEDAAALWRLAERLDRELDTAFAPRSKRAAQADSDRKAGGIHNSHEFQTR